MTPCTYTVQHIYCNLYIILFSFFKDCRVTFSSLGKHNKGKLIKTNMYYIYNSIEGIT